MIAITDENGEVVATLTYDVWGVPTEFDAGGNKVEIGTWTLPTGGTPGNGLFFLFGGMLYDALAGLYLTRTRAYNPKTGRFLERDILDEKGKKGIYKGFPFGEDAIGTNLYAWCKNNPVLRWKTETRLKWVPDPPKSIRMVCSQQKVRTSGSVKNLSHFLSAASF